jgi:hypothetical protein
MNEFIEGVRNVEFDAHNSFVANCTNCTSVNLCPACPSGKICYNVTGLVNGILEKKQCYNLNKTGAEGIGNNPGQYNLWFDWSFFTLINNNWEKKASRYGSWLYNYSYAIEFNQSFFDPGKHKATLKVGYEPF